MPQIPQIAAEVADDEEAERERGGQDRRRERREEERDRRDEHQLDENQPIAFSIAGSSAGRIPRALHVRADAPRHVGQHQHRAPPPYRDVDGQRQHQADVLAEDELIAIDRLGQQAVDAAPLHFLRDQADADEDGDEQAEDRRRRQTEVLDDLDVLPGGELADQVRRADQQQSRRATRL